MSDGGLMAGAEAADEGEVIRNLEYFFDFVELEGALAHIVLVVDGVFNQGSWALEYVLQEEEVGLEKVSSLALLSGSGASDTITFLVEPTIVLHKLEQSFSKVGLLDF